MMDKLEQNKKTKATGKVNKSASVAVTEELKKKNLYITLLAISTAVFFVLSAVFLILFLGAGTCTEEI